MDVVRDHPAGHVGATPQDTFDIVGSSRAAGELQDFREHLEPHPRVDDILARPLVAAEPGYFRDDTALLQITGAVARMQPSVMRQPVDPKTFGGLPDENAALAGNGN